LEKVQAGIMGTSDPTTQYYSKSCHFNLIIGYYKCEAFTPVTFYIDKLHVKTRKTCTCTPLDCLIPKRIPLCFNLSDCDVPVIEAEPVPNLNPLAAFLSVEDISTPNRFDLANLF
jgi:hypothetical protein